MPVESIIVSAAVVAMFVIFGSVLCWGERQTRTATPAEETASPKKRRSF